jgi:hypothetical protein
MRSSLSGVDLAAQGGELDGLGKVRGEAEVMA